MSDFFLNDPGQYDFVMSQQPSVAAIAGFGSGKTHAVFSKILKWLVDYPGVPMGYFAPTYGLIRDIFVPTVEKFCEQSGLACEFLKQDSKMIIQGFAPIFCRSMKNPSSIVGFEIGNAGVDEIDILTVLNAWEAWRKIKARCRIRLYTPGKKHKQKNEVKNQMALASTPEGYKFAYEAFKKKPLLNSAFYQMSTYDNEHNLPLGYIDELMANYPPQLVDAYIRGIFTNLLSGTVYTSFDRVLSNAPGIHPKKGEQLQIGMDFNVGNMSAVVHVNRKGYPVAVGEIVGVYDTPTMINSIRELYGRHYCTIYPDATGSGRSTVNASTSDIKLLSNAGFYVKVEHSNPAIRDRVNSMNGMFCNGDGDRRYKVNVDECPVYTECLEQQAYDLQGLPDKKTNKDHLPDAGGYYINREFGIAKPSSGTGRVIL